MDTARMARTGMVWLGTIMLGATWGEFFPVATLCNIVLGVALAFVALFVASFMQ